MARPLADRRIGLLTSSASRLGGGVFEAVVAQARIIRELGAEAVVFAIADEHSRSDEHRFSPGKVVACESVGPRQIGFAPAMLERLLDAKLDCLHLHGIWMHPSRAGTLWARRTGRAYIVSPHGMLDPWILSRGRWKKALARVGYERASWRAATMLHALTGREAEDIARETGRCDSLVIANAGPAPGRERSHMPSPVVAYIGRVHPKKNLGALIAAWAKAQTPMGARLVLAGWGDEGDVDALRQQVAVAGPDVEFLGPVFGAEKQGLLDRARFVILPSHSEGLPMAVLEAWAAATPTIMTSECNLPDGFLAGAAIECGYDAHAISAVLERALAMPEGDWLAMSAAALNLARADYSPARIAGDWEQAYLAAMRAAGAGA